MELKKFRNKYDLELIAASHAGIIIGTLVWDPLIGKPVFDHSNMPNHLFNAFRDAKLLNDDEYLNMLEMAKSENLVAANLAEIVIDVDVSLASTLENPQIGKISNSFDFKRVKKFTFGELKACTMSNLQRVRIDDYLEELKVNKWEDYDGKIRRVFMITELYFGSIKLIIEQKVKSDFDAAIKKGKLSVGNELKLGTSIEYTFDHQNVPFAMRIERVKNFNG